MEEEKSKPESPPHSGVCLKMDPDIGLPLQPNVMDQTNENTQIENKDRNEKSESPIQNWETNNTTRPKDTRQQSEITEDGETSSKTTQVDETIAGTKRETTQNIFDGTTRENTEDGENVNGRQNELNQGRENGTRLPRENTQDGENRTRPPSEITQDHDNETRPPNETTQGGENDTKRPSENTQDGENRTRPPSELTQDRGDETRPPNETTQGGENGTRPPSETTQDGENCTGRPSETTPDQENCTRPSESTQNVENVSRTQNETTQYVPNITSNVIETEQHIEVDKASEPRPKYEHDKLNVTSPATDKSAVTETGDTSASVALEVESKENVDVDSNIRMAADTHDAGENVDNQHNTENKAGLLKTETEVNLNNNLHCRETDQKSPCEEKVEQNKDSMTSNSEYNAKDSMKHLNETESIHEVSRTIPSAMIDRDGTQGVHDIPAVKTGIPGGAQVIRVVFKSPQSDTNVSFQSPQSVHIDPAETLKEAELPEGVQRLKKELERMQFEDDKKRNAEKMKKKAEVVKLKAKLKNENKRQKIAVDLNTDLHKTFIASELAKEELVALAVERNRLNEETRQMARYLDKKHAITERRKAGGAGRLLKKMEKDAKRPPRQDDITRELTRDEVTDLHMAFDMFDKKRRGLLTISDLKRLGKMLKLPVSKDPLKTLIADWDKKKRGVVEFDDFLTLVIAAQGDGPDPYEEITQGFDMIDVEGKGFITFDDLRKAADETGERFSNTMLREMVTEADCTGDGRISQRDFVRIMLDTNRYRVIKKAMNL